MLCDNDTPYYVGCTRKGESRWPKRLHLHFETLETTTDRNTAAFLEMYWMDQIRSWGFSLKNDPKHRRPYTAKEPNHQLLSLCNQKLLAIAKDVEAIDRLEALWQLRIKTCTTGRYLNGRATNIDKGVKLLLFLRNRIESRKAANVS